MSNLIINPFSRAGQIYCNSAQNFLGGMGNYPLGGGVQLSATDTLAKNINQQLISYNWVLLSYSYNSFSIVKSVIDVPVNDAFKGGLRIMSDQLDDANKKEVYKWLEEKKAIEIIKNAVRWTRLYGGGGIIIDDGRDADSFFNINFVGKETDIKLYAVDLWELGRTLDDSQGVQTGIPNFYDWDKSSLYFYGKKLDRSRAILLNGEEPPSLIKRRLRGWGQSKLEPLVRPLNQYLKNQNVGFELLDEAKIDVFKLADFSNMMQNEDGEKDILEMVEFANQVKSYKKALVMDKEDDFQRHPYSFSNIEGVSSSADKSIANATNIPINKLFGQSQSGLNTNEEDLEIIILR